MTARRSRYYSARTCAETLTCATATIPAAGWRGASDQLRFGFAASSALRYGPGCVRLVLPALLDETAQPHVELVLGISFDKVLQLWAVVCLEQVRLADDAFRLLVTLDV